MKGGHVASFVLGFLTCSLLNLQINSRITSFLPALGDNNDHRTNVKNATATECTTVTAAVVCNETVKPECNCSDQTHDQIHDQIHSKPKNPSWEPMVQQEIIPPSLRDTFSPDNIHVNVTRSMLRRSRPVVGNVQRLQTFLKKLQRGHCTTIYAYGGSVTGGHNAGGPKNSYLRWFMDWLNARYPCVDNDSDNDNDNDNKGEHKYRKDPSLSSQAAMSSGGIYDYEGNIDLVLIEYNVNDPFIKTIPHALEDKGDAKKNDESYRTLFYNEILIRRLLLVRKPEPVAVVLFNADYIGRIWASWEGSPYHNPGKARRHAFRSNSAASKYWVSTVYEIPMISANAWMLPMANKFGFAMQFNRTYPFNTAAWHVDACCHPKKSGHRLLALILAFALEEEMKSMNQGEHLADWERDFTMDSPPQLRDPLYLNQEEENLWVHNSMPNNTTRIDFQDPHNAAAWRDFVVSNQGWSWFADNRDQDKFGLITNATRRQGADPPEPPDQKWEVPHVAFQVTGGPMGIIEVAFIASYQTFGDSLMWLADAPADSPFVGNTNCTPHGLKRAGIPSVQTLGGRWYDPVSVPKFEMFRSLIEPGENKILHVCLVEPTKEDFHKFKLQLIRLL